MRLFCGKHSMGIYPENTTEEVYLEEVFGLKHAGDTCIAKRINHISLGCWLYLKICGKEEEKLDNLKGD